MTHIIFGYWLCFKHFFLGLQLMEEGRLGNLVVVVVAITFPNLSKFFKTAVINGNSVEFNTLEELILVDSFPYFLP